MSQKQAETTSNKDRFIFIWQVFGHDNQWKPTGSKLTTKLESLPLNVQTMFTSGSSSYSVTKISKNTGIRTNVRTQNHRDLRRILVDRTNGYRVVWESKDKRGDRIRMNEEMNLKMSMLEQWEQIEYDNKRHYTITKMDDTHCIRMRFGSGVTTKCYTLTLLDRAQPDEPLKSRGMFRYLDESLSR